MSYILTAVAIAVRLADHRFPETTVETTPAFPAPIQLPEPAETRFLVTRDGIELTDGVSWLQSSHIVYAEDWA